MSITHGNADTYETDAMTVSGRKISIKINEAGYYRIDVDGPGEKPDLCNQLFTGLKFARQAVAAYVQDNKADIEKRQMIMDIASRPDKPRKNAKTNTE